jgi:hypothetical protein
MFDQEVGALFFETNSPVMGFLVAYVLQHFRSRARATIKPANAGDMIREVKELTGYEHSLLPRPKLPRMRIQ